MSKPKPEKISFNYVDGINLFSVLGTNVFHAMASLEDTTFDQYIRDNRQGDEALAVVRFFKTSVVRVKHSEAVVETITRAEDAVEDGGRTQVIRDEQTFPQPDKTKYVVGFNKEANLPVFASGKDLIKQGSVPPSLQESLAELALQGYWYPEFSALLPLMPDQPANLNDFQSMLRFGSRYPEMIDGPMSIPVDY